METETQALNTLHVDTLDGSTIPITASDQISTQELKQKICDMTGIPMEKIRLLRKGKKLADDEVISDINITTRVQLVASLHEEEDLVSMISQYNFLRTLRVYRRLSRFPRPLLSQPYLYETLRQNSLTIDSMIRMRRDDGFHLEDRILEEGQWVDVKDTVGQWLEAQVIRIEHTRARTVAFIHYNGWPEGWDEWIDVRSRRIRPFRTKTLQPLNMASRSPFPAYPPELLYEEENQMAKFTSQACFYIDHMQSIVKESIMLSNLALEGKEESKTQVNNLAYHSAPIIDRIGRFLSDFSHAISRTDIIPARRATL